MRWCAPMRLGTMGGALALSACAMSYDRGLYEPPPPAAYSAYPAADDYAFIDRADSLWEAIGDAPPDFAFEVDGAEPWAWQTGDGHRIVVEETPQGIHSYYFEPGGDGPFLAVKPGMSFGYEGEAVSVVYGADGGAMSRPEGAPHLEEGAALYARARLLHRAMLQQQWRSVDTQAWIDASPLIWGSVQIWDEGKRRDPRWGRYHDRWREAQWRRRLDEERLRRRGLAEQFKRWKEGGFQGPPPGRFRRPGEHHRPGTGRPNRPGQPGAGVPGTQPPRQPGAPGAGRPPRPDAGQAQPPRRGPRRPEKLGPPEGGVVEPDAPAALPAPVPGAGIPRRGNNERPRPRREVPVPGTPSDPQAQRPDSNGPRWPRPEGARPGWYRRRDTSVQAPAAPSAQPMPRPAKAADAPRERRGSREERTRPVPTASPPARRASPPPSRPSRPSSPTGVKGNRDPGDRVE
jgi:hypothetical protein